MSGAKGEIAGYLCFGTGSLVFRTPEEMEAARKPRRRRWRNCLKKRQQEQVLRHPAVESLEFEENGAGEEYVRDVWIYLKPGYICRSMGCGLIHEYTWEDVKSHMAEIEPGESE